MNIENTPISELLSFVTPIHFDTPFVGTPSEIFEKVKKNPENTYPFRITLSDEPAGFFTVSLTDPEIDFLKGDNKNCWIGSFFIAEKFHGKGLAKQALKFMPEILKSKFPYLSHISLTVNMKNTKAAKLYLKSGFSDTGKIFEGGPIGPQYIFTMNI